MFHDLIRGNLLENIVCLLYSTAVIKIYQFHLKIRMGMSRYLQYTPTHPTSSFLLHLVSLGLILLLLETIFKATSV